MPKPRNLPAPENDNIADYDDVKALSLYDVRSIATAHADVFAKALYPPAECDGITVLTEILREDGRIARDIIWRVTNLSPEEVNRLPEWEIRRFVLFAICRTHRTAEAGRRVRRAIIASVNAVCKGRNRATPLGLKATR